MLNSNILQRSQRLVFLSSQSWAILRPFICALVIFSHLAFMFPNIIARQCDSEWCLPGIPDFDPVEELLGGAAAGWGVISNFVLPPPPTPTDEDSGTKLQTTPDIEQSVVAPTNQKQCQNLPDWQPGQVSLLLELSSARGCC